MNSLAHYTDADNASRESSCVAYFARFCERAKAEMNVAETVRNRVRAEGHAQRPPKVVTTPRPLRAKGPGVSMDSAVPGMWVSRHAVDVARRWSAVDHPTRRREKGILKRYADEAGISISVLKKLDQKIRLGQV